MNSRAITLIATIAVIGIVAVGAGYAYTALTLNEGNNASAQYITLTQTPAYSFNTSFNEVFDTATAGSAPTAGWKISNPTTVTISTTDYTVFVIGTVTLHATPTGYATNAALPTATLSVDNSIQASDNFTNGASVLKYYLVDSTNAIVGTYVNGTGWQNAAGTANISIALTKNSDEGVDPVVGYEDVQLKLCYGYVATAATNFHDMGNYIQEQPAASLTGGKIIFKVTTS